MEHFLPLTTLFHFSEDPAIRCFHPRPVRTPSPRPDGQDWLNGPLVWAIDAWHQPLYVFPRECPRILLWPTPGTTAADRLRWLGTSTARMLACVEKRWLAAIECAVLYRYTLPAESFMSLEDAGMWVSRTSVVPEECTPLTGLPDLLARAGVELRVLPDLNALRGVWESSLHASGIRLRNAISWT